MTPPVQVTLSIALTNEGATSLAMGTPLYPWQFEVRMPEGNLYKEHDKTSLPFASLTATLPSVNSCLKQAEAVLREKLQTIRAEAEVAAMEVQKQLNTLLAISYTPTAEPEVEPEVEWPDQPEPEALGEEEDLSWRDTATCIITGCDLQFQNDGRYHGDLWRDGGTWYFNGIWDTAAPGTVLQNTENADYAGGKALVVDEEDAGYWIGRVYQISAIYANLTLEASNYINHGKV